MSAERSGRAFLSLRDAAFRLGDCIVFEHTSWTFHRHEHWAMVGANGSGKSLLADGLRGRLPLVEGELRYHFRPPAGLTPEESIGHVAFEDRKADVHETVVQSRWNSLEEEGALLVRDSLAYDRVMEVNPFEVTSLHDQLRPKFERRCHKAVGLLRVTPFLDRRLISLSNGVPASVLTFDTFQQRTAGKGKVWSLKAELGPRNGWEEDRAPIPRTRCCVKLSDPVPYCEMSISGNDPLYLSWSNQANGTSANTIDW